MRVHYAIFQQWYQRSNALAALGEHALAIGRAFSTPPPWSNGEYSNLTHVPVLKSLIWLTGQWRMID